MKKTFFGVLSMSLVLGLSLTSCAPSKVSEEEGKARLASIKQAYKEDKVEMPNKITFKMDLNVNSSTSGGGESATEKLNTSAVYALDLESYRAYSLVEASDGEDKTAIETWFYIQDGYAVQAMLSDGVGQYAKVSVDQEKVDELFTKSNEIYDQLLETLTDSAAEIADDFISTSDDLTLDAAIKMYGASIKFKNDATYRSDGEGSFAFESNIKITGAVDKATQGTGKISSYSSIEIDNFLLKSITNESHLEMSNSLIKTTNSIEMYATTALKANIKLPDLSKFEQKVA